MFACHWLYIICLWSTLFIFSTISHVSFWRISFSQPSYFSHIVDIPNEVPRFKEYYFSRCCYDGFEYLPTMYIATHINDTIHWKLSILNIVIFLKNITFILKCTRFFIFYFIGSREEASCWNFKDEQMRKDVFFSTWK